jgi:hypothetical protein
MMHMSVFIQPEVAEAIIDLIDEMSTEIDLFYEDDQLAGASPAFMKMDRMVTMLQSSGYQPPDTYLHIVTRYKKSVN